MIRKLKQWFIEAVSNGGGVLLLAAVALGGVGGAVAINPISNLLSPAREPAGVQTVGDNWACPDSTWTRNIGANADVGSNYITCSKNHVIIRHFDNPPANVKQEAYQDQGVYPFHDLDTSAEAVQIANSR